MQRCAKLRKQRQPSELCAVDGQRINTNAEGPLRATERGMVGGGVDRRRAMKGGPPQPYPMCSSLSGLALRPRIMATRHGHYVYVD
jgi:hypothetical protein